MDDKAYHRMQQKIENANPDGFSFLLVTVNTDLLHFQQNVSLELSSNPNPLTLIMEWVDTFDPVINSFHGYQSYHQSHDLNGTYHDDWPLVVVHGS